MLYGIAPGIFLPETKYMKHFYTLLKHFYIMKQITENTILFMLLIIGGLGLLFHYNNKASDANNEFEIVLMQHESAPSSHKQISQKSMKISGTQEVGFPLNFEIGDLTSNVQYILELGNGDRLDLTNNQSYTYEKPGNYHVKLIAVKKDNQELLQSTKLQITQHLAAGPSIGGSAN